MMPEARIKAKWEAALARAKANPDLAWSRITEAMWRHAEEENHELETLCRRAEKYVQLIRTMPDADVRAEMDAWLADFAAAFPDPSRPRKAGE